MSSLNNMIRAMSPIPMYSLKKIAATVYKELQSYAAELDALSEIVDELITECFLSTACDYGLSLYEKLSGKERTDLPLELRREMLIKSQMLGINDNTLDGIYRFFESLGLQCDINESPEICSIYVLAKGRVYSKTEQDYIIEMAEKFLPCHLDFTIDFRTVDWAYFDNLSLTFDEIDSKNYTWDNFERYEEEQ